MTKWVAFSSYFIYKAFPYFQYDVRLTGKPNIYRFVPLHMLIGGHHFFRQQEPIPDDHAIWDTNLAVEERIAKSTEFAMDNLIPIYHPFRHPCLQILHSHVHPFCVIVKAGQALLMCDYLIPSSLHRVVQIISSISMKWQGPFPTKELRAVGSKASSHPSPSDSGSHRSRRLAPYPPASSQFRFGSADLEMDISGGMAGNVDNSNATAGKSAHAGQQMVSVPFSIRLGRNS
jgi:hypothetical protein